ncbi:PREDICTED: uncharacterized protein LOC108569557 [Nicrophorus vespilloides]|uniref:lysozyme n=1 Tax=Nicrophorus vespilloides TaxID=110193 RepID=A0ABM1NII4_NICVS|nr:PREDICTED: uncharacterized protein LOC108569557 [Nicrophorus vespilloides]
MKLATFLVLILITTQVDLTIYNFRSCIKCICHSVSLCYLMKNCAKFSITFDYWRAADSPHIGAHTTDREAFELCQNNDDCIYETIENYIINVGQHDCNCDGVIDCNDFLFLHYGKCRNPSDIPNFELKKKYYMECMQIKQPIMYCDAEEI